MKIFFFLIFTNALSFEYVSPQLMHKPGFEFQYQAAGKQKSIPLTIEERKLGFCQNTGSGSRRVTATGGKRTVEVYKYKNCAGVKNVTQQFFDSAGAHTKTKKFIGID